MEAEVSAEGSHESVDETSAGVCERRIWLQPD